MNELVNSIKGIPTEAVALWRDSHTRTAWLRAWENGNYAQPGDRPLFDLGDTNTINSWEDYKLWSLLGVVTDALLVLILVLIICAVVL